MIFRAVRLLIITSCDFPPRLCNHPAHPLQVQCQWSLTPSQQSWLSSVVFLGFLVGAYCWGLLADERGRKVGFLVPAFLTCAAGLASALAHNY